MAFALSPLWHAEVFLTPKPSNFLVIDDPALAAGVMVSGTKTAAGTLLGVGPQPLPQGGVRIGGSPRDGLVALGGAVLPVTRQANRSLTPSTRWR